MNSYFYLLCSRFCIALSININIEASHKEMMIPPLTLQMVTENIMNQNSFSRSRPLYIIIHSVENDLEIKHNVQPRINGTGEGSEVLENIASKFRLLGQKDIIITEAGNERYIRMPFIINREMAVV